MPGLKLIHVSKRGHWGWSAAAFCITASNHLSGVPWAPWQLKSLATRLFVEQLVQGMIKVNIKAGCHCSFASGIQHKRTVMWKRFPRHAFFSLLEVCGSLIKVKCFGWHLFDGGNLVYVWREELTGISTRYVSSFGVAMSLKYELLPLYTKPICYNINISNHIWDKKTYHTIPIAVNIGWIHFLFYDKFLCDQESVY